MKRAILQCADSGPLESLVVMLSSADYECFLPSERLKHDLRALGCDTVLDVDNLVRGMGYDQPMKLPEADVKAMDIADLYVDIKAHRNGPKVWKRWPVLRNKTLWYRINGGKPEHVIKPSGEDCGDEINLLCPILTPDLWYRDTPDSRDYPSYNPVRWNSSLVVNAWSNLGPSSQHWHDAAYPCYPPFYRFDEYMDSFPRPGAVNKGNLYQNPICLIHNVEGWGYRDLISSVRELGVRCYGAGSPDGLLQHREVGARLGRALCMVHLKSSDAPGYALYEALAAGCPIILTRRLIWRNKMQELFVPGETCLAFDRETHDGLTAQDIEECTAEVKFHLHTLADYETNRRIGEAGRKRLQEVMWNVDRDGQSFREFMGRHFG